MSESLAIEGREYEWTIVWIIDGDTGATLGQDVYKDADLARVDDDSWDHIAATLAVSKTKGAKHNDRRHQYEWERLEDAKAALRVARAAVKDKSGKPLPEWAVKALAAGWKAPKGWSP